MAAQSEQLPYASSRNCVTGRTPGCLGTRPSAQTNLRRAELDEGLSPEPLLPFVLRPTHFSLGSQEQTKVGGVPGLTDLREGPSKPCHRRTEFSPIYFGLRETFFLSK